MIYKSIDVEIDLLTYICINNVVYIENVRSIKSVKHFSQLTIKKFDDH